MSASNDESVGPMEASQRSSIPYADGVFRAQGGALTAAEALARGVSRYTLRRMVASGHLERLSRGLYRLVDLPPVADPDLLAVSAAIPRGVICLVSALSFHGLTTRIPRRVDVAVPAHSRRPSLSYPPTQVYWFSQEAHEAGVERHVQHGAPLPVYCAEKTIADTFKFRNRVGLNVALEALRLYAESGTPDADALFGYARICRVQQVMRPYLEALL